MFVSDEVDRNNGQRAAEPASECHNTANDDVELDCPSLCFFFTCFIAIWKNKDVFTSLSVYSIYIYKQLL